MCKSRKLIDGLASGEATNALLADICPAYKESSFEADIVVKFNRH